MTELALAVFASETGTHLIRPPRPALVVAPCGASTRARTSSGSPARGFRFVARSAPAFPPLLRAIHDPPPGLFLRGDAERRAPRAPAVAIVGARACSGYGASVARSLGARPRARGPRRRLRAGARHRRRGAPRRARGRRRDGRRARLRHRPRLSGGARRARAAHRRERPLVSEYAPGVEPAPWRFPARNRIVAGLCAATVVVEARERSGALITADLALEEGREVFTVPGEITSALSAGTNALLKLGASPLTARARRPRSLRHRRRAERRSSRGALLDLLPASADELVRRTGRPPPRSPQALVELELAGSVAAHDGIYRVQ